MCLNAPRHAVPRFPTTHPYSALPTLSSHPPSSRKENPTVNVVEELGGKGAVLEVEPLSQRSDVIDSFNCRSFKWQDLFKDNYMTSEFPVGLNKFYKARTGVDMTRRQIRNFYGHMADLRGGGLFGGFGYRFTLKDSQGEIITTHVREI